MTQLRDARTRRGWTQSELIGQLRAAARATGRMLPADETLRSMISRWEAGQHKPGALYRHLFDAVYEVGETTGQPRTTALRSHQFIPAWLGATAARDVVGAGRMTRDVHHWTVPHRCQMPLPTSASACTCDLYVWQHGVAIFHVVDERSFPSLAALALWRDQTYDERLSWATSQLQPMAPDARAAYVLSLYWLTASAWSGHDYETAMRIMCMPRVLLSRDDANGGSDGFKHAQARLAEDALLAARWDHPGVRSFGVAGTSSGYASWSGVVYHAQSTSRALSEDELVAYELVLQSAWAYCAHLNDEIEQGRDPFVPDDWGWRYLRGVRCRLANARPQESGQHRSMREAILETSGVMGHLDQAIETLREGAR
jgi:transcriptional regulator with XRE-family HTH domain